MPRRALDPGSKPFEVKVGLGFQSFGGMYQLGDPSMCPPNRFRKLINVRLGGKDVASRPGQVTAWTSTVGEPVVGMIEILKREAPQIFFGPSGANPAPVEGGTVWWDPDPATTITQPLYFSLLLDSPALTNPMPNDRVLSYILFKRPKYESGSYQERAQWQIMPGIMAPVGHQPYCFQSGLGRLVADGRTYLYSPRSYHGPYALGEVSDVIPPVFTEASFSHEHLLEDIFTSGGITYQGLFPDDGQWGSCLDPIVRFQGKWLAVGSIFPIVLNPGVLGNKASGDPGTGQQIFEVNFNTEIRDQPPPGLAWTYANPQVGHPFAPGVVDNFFGGGVSEVFRMPGVSVSVIPTRDSGGLTDGKTVRSMCVRQVRADHPLSAAQATSEKLYLGTFGGAPLTPGAWKTVDVEYKYPIHNLTNGEVYSWDGSTLKLETTGLGPAVVVCALPDGGVIACGRSAAKYLSPGTDTWAAVAYDPVASLLPRSTATPGNGPLEISVTPDPDWLPTGFLWTDRVVFRGEAYFVGWDTAFLASNAKINGFFVSNLFGLTPPPASGRTEYRPSVDAWVLYKFDRAAMKMIEVRRGTDIETDVNTDVAFNTEWEFMYGSVGDGPCLAVWNDALYYSWTSYWHTYDPFPPWDPPLPRIGLMAGCGAFDGVTFDDDAVYMRLDEDQVVNSSHFERIGDMLATAGALYMTNYIVLDGGGGPTPIHQLQEWNGSTRVERVSSWYTGGYSSGGEAVALAPGFAHYHRMFMGVR